jgi:hypothetical protein
VFQNGKGKVKKMWLGAGAGVGKLELCGEESGTGSG